jgi:trimethylamine--corrinoid protein Co-methyltransferase
MKEMIFPYGGADRLPTATAAMQLLLDFYGRPGGCHGGKTDACSPGVQVGMEKALSIILPVLAEATGVGTLGHVENALTFSYEQLVINDAITGYIRRMLQGFEVNQETLAFDVIREVGPDGNLLAHPHTATHFREEFYLPDIVERMPYAVWEGQDIRDMDAKAREKASVSSPNTSPGRWTRRRNERSTPSLPRQGLTQSTHKHHIFMFVPPVHQTW